MSDFVLSRGVLIPFSEGFRFEFDSYASTLQDFNREDFAGRGCRVVDLFECFLDFVEDFWMGGVIWEDSISLDRLDGDLSGFDRRSAYCFVRHGWKVGADYVTVGWPVLRGGLGCWLLICDLCGEFVNVLLGFI